MTKPDNHVAPDPNVAVFVGGRGEIYGKKYTKDTIWTSLLFFDKDGRVMSPIDKDGNPRDPSADPNFKEWRFVEVVPGGLCIMPFWDKEAMQVLYRTGQFAKQEAYNEINKMYAEKIDGKIILAAMRDKGLIITDPNAPKEPAPELPSKKG